MSASMWRQFVADVEQLVTSCGGTIYATAYGAGEWDGVAEEAVVITFGDAEAEKIADELPWLALAYGQEVIALLVGTTVLVEQVAPADVQGARGGSG
jgi:hypothetical protein